MSSWGKRRDKEKEKPFLTGKRREVLLSARNAPFGGIERRKKARSAFCTGPGSNESESFSGLGVGIKYTYLEKGNKKEKGSLPVTTSK